MLPMLMETIMLSITANYAYISAEKRNGLAGRTT